MRSLDRLPPFSPRLKGLLVRLSDEDSSFQSLASMIEQDAVIAGNVLKLVNSALYGRRGTVSSIRAAISILGLVKLRNFILGISLSRMWAGAKTPKSWDLSRFNRHGTATAVFADLIVQRIAVPAAEGAFAAGLLHDIGLLMIAVALPDTWERVQVQHLLEDWSEEVEVGLFGVTHAELSGAALARWALPAAVQQAVRHHHRAEPPVASAGGLGLAQVIACADRAAKAAGHGFLGPAAINDQLMDLVLAEVGLTNEREGFLRDFETEFEAMRLAT